MENSKIQWTRHTFNPWTGCTRVSPGCQNCYAEAWSKRSGIVEWGPGKPRRRTAAALWNKVRKWNTEAAGAAERPRVFCASLADWLDPEVPAEWRRDLLMLIADCPNLDFLLLSKRPEQFVSLVGEVADQWQSSCELAVWWMRGIAPANVWIGTTVEDQKRADLRIPLVVRIPAEVRFLSCEPLLGPVTLRRLDDDDGNTLDSLTGDWGVEGRGHTGPRDERIHWVIAGGESGSGARPMEIDWARSLKDQCAAAGVPFFMKQLGGVSGHRGELSDFPEDLRIREFPNPAKP